MADLKQLEHGRDTVELATVLLDLMADIDLHLAVMFANQYNQDTPKSFVDADFEAEDRDLGHLDAATYYAAINALSALRDAYEANGNKTAIAKTATGTLRR